MLDAMLPIGEGNRVLAQVSAGKIDELIAQTYKGDHENMKQAINNVATVLQGLQKELGRLTQASREGQLNERGKADQFKGAYGEIVLGVNTMLDAILLPIGEGNRILAQVSAGKIDELIAQTYKGDHEKMKQAINNVATVLQDLQKEMGRLTQASREGQLTERGKADQFKGAYGEIVSGVNGRKDFFPSRGRRVRDFFPNDGGPNSCRASPHCRRPRCSRLLPKSIGGLSHTVLWKTRPPCWRTCRRPSIIFIGC